eukprot:15058541-Alexandrium_andersonii.AAC.1
MQGTHSACRSQVDSTLQDSVGSKAVAGRQHRGKLAPLDAPLLLHEGAAGLVSLLRFSQLAAEVGRE